MPRNAGKLGCDVVADFCMCRTDGCKALSCACRSDTPKPANMNNAQNTVLQWAFIFPVFLSFCFEPDTFILATLCTRPVTPRLGQSRVGPARVSARFHTLPSLTSRVRRMLFSVILVVVPTERRQRFDSMKCPFARCSRLFRKQDRL